MGPAGVCHCHRHRCQVKPFPVAFPSAEFLPGDLLFPSLESAGMGFWAGFEYGVTEALPEGVLKMVIFGRPTWPHLFSLRSTLFPAGEVFRPFCHQARKEGQKLARRLNVNLLLCHINRCLSLETSINNI